MFQEVDIEFGSNPEENDNDDQIPESHEDIDENEREGSMEPTDEQVLRGMEEISTSQADDVRRRAPAHRPKLNETTICSADKGIPRIPKLFEGFKPNSRLDEYGNLDLVMHKLEHWAHCLFPKLAFDDFIARAESLGHKRPVQACLNKIRLGLPLLDEDFEKDSALTAEPEEQRQGIIEAETDSCTHNSPDMPSSVDTTTNEKIPDSTLTKEQMERMEANRKKALELRGLRIERERNDGISSCFEFSADTANSNGAAFSNTQDISCGTELDIGATDLNFSPVMDWDADRFRKEEQLIDEDELLRTLEESD